MSSQPITTARAFEYVRPEEMREVLRQKSQHIGHPAVKEAVQFLIGKGFGEAVKVKVHSPGRLRRMRESAIGFANRRGFHVSTFHKAGWLYIQRVED
jgi:hypothetical protein